MSTIFNVRNLKVPGVSRTALVIGTVVLIAAIVAAFFGWKAYQRLTKNTVTAYFTQTLALYPGTRCRSWASRSARSRRSSPTATR